MFEFWQFLLGTQKRNQKLRKNSVIEWLKMDVGKNSGKMLSELTEVQKVLEPAHFFLKFPKIARFIWQARRFFISFLSYSGDRRI